MSRIIEATPGQGITEGGMGNAEGIHPVILYDVAQTTRESLGDVGGDIHRLLTDASTAEIHSSQVNIQLAILATERAAQLSMDKALEVVHGQDSAEPDIVIGHSVGEFAGLVRKGVIEYGYAVQLVYERARLMDICGRKADDGGFASPPGSKKQPGGAMVVIGLHEEELEEKLKDTNIRIAGENGEILFTVSGPEEELDLLASGLNTRPVSTNVAVHNPLFMTDAAKGLRQWIEDDKQRDTRFADPKEGTVVVNGEFAVSGEEVITGITEGIAKPVRWAKGIETAVDEAQNRGGEDQNVLIIEVNPGRLALLPMMRNVSRRPGVVTASFTDVVRYGLEPDAIKAGQKADRKKAE